MKRFISLAMCVVVVMAFAGVADAAKDNTGPAVGRDYSGYHFAQDGANLGLTSNNSSGVRFKASAFTDTFCLYGRGATDPCGTQGRFDNGTGVVPQNLGHDQGCTIIPDCWFGVDLTDQPTLWQITPNASVTDQQILDCTATLGNTGGANNHVAWAGQSSLQQPGWTASPGYGNNWNAFLQWSATLANAGVPQTVGLDFYFHHDSEPAYDFFNVEYDSFNTTVNVYTVDGSNAPFSAPGVHYPADVVTDVINYEAGGYAGPGNNQIILRLTATSDGAWSDEDGLWPTDCGLAMVDDITVNYSEGSTFDDFEGPTWVNWAPIKAPYAGDFSDIHPRLTDIDPCRENFTPVAAFIDYGQCPKNGDNNCGNPACSSTGGSTSGTWSYGIPGGWVTNYQGGISNGVVDLTNEVWSPPIAFDLPGTEDDADDIAGSFFSFSVWRHLPLLNGQFYVWHIRSTTDVNPVGAVWSTFDDRNFVYYSNGGNWLNVNNAVSDLVNVGGEKPVWVQLACGVTDLANLFAFPGNDATPSPAFDNVAYCKYPLQGPVFATRDIDRFMESFPQSGNFDWHTLAGRQDSDCRIDMRDVSSGALNTPGDSMIVDILSAIPGADLNTYKVCWIMDKNPKFDDARDPIPPGATLIPGGAANGWDQWTGCADGDTAKVAGVPVTDRFFFDLPDAGFAHPGDVIRYYIEATDTQGRRSTLPGNIDPLAFTTGRSAAGDLYPPNHTLNMLPSIVDDGQGGWTQPWILVWNDFGFRGGVNDYYQAFNQNGWRRGIEWDMYTTWGPTSGVSNGLGSAGAHGAVPGQIGGYEVMIYLAGDLGSVTMSDGTDSGNNDKGDDLSLMTGWFNQDADRFVAHFGDDLVSALLDDSPGPGGAYVQTVMGVQFGDNVVKDEIDNQSSPVVIPAVGSPWFVEEYVAFGGCLGPNEFDSVGALPGAVRSHEFTMPGGTVPYGPPNRAASVTWDRLDGNLNRKVSIHFPYGLVYVWNKSGSVSGGPNPPPTTPPGFSSRGRLLKEIIEDCFDHFVGPGGGPVATDGPSRKGFWNLAVYPTPFNPSTKIFFELGQKEAVRIDVYNIRGERVITLHDGVMEAGPRSVTWSGVDSRGVPVSSGVYIAKVQTKTMTQTVKAVMVK